MSSGWKWQCRSITPGTTKSLTRLLASLQASAAGDVQRQRAARAKERAGGGDHAAPNLGQGEPRGGRGHDQVARQGDLEAAPVRGAFDGCDEGLRAPAPDHAVLPAALRPATARFQ